MIPKCHPASKTKGNRMELIVRATDYERLMRSRNKTSQTHLRGAMSDAHLEGFSSRLLQMFLVATSVIAFFLFDFLLQLFYRCLLLRFQFLPSKKCGLDSIEKQAIIQTSRKSRSQHEGKQRRSCRQRKD